MLSTLNRGGARLSTKPSQYPLLAFHLLRLAQLLSALIVSSVLIFFVHHLHREHYYIPWTFILLLTVSLLTPLILIFTTVSHIFGTLTPRTNTLFNTALTLLWALGLALLSWNLGWTLGHRCVISTWQTEGGIMVCRLYKALTAFTVTGVSSTILALMLDLRTQQKSTNLGRYNVMADIKAPVGDVRSSSPFHNEGRVDGDYGREPSHDLQRPYRVQKPIEASTFGYAHPEGQTSYEGGGGAGWL